VCASVNLPFHHEVQKFSSGTGSPGWSRKKGYKTLVVWFLSSFFIPYLISAVADWMSTILLHMVWPWCSCLLHITKNDYGRTDAAVTFV